MILSTILIAVISILIDHALLNRKKSFVFCLFTFVITQSLLLLIGFLSKMYIQDLVVLKFTYYFIAFASSFIYMFLVFSESISKIIFTLFSVWMFSTIALFFATLVASLLLGIVDLRVMQTLIYIIRIALLFLFFLAVYFGANKHYKSALNIVTNRTMAFMSIYPMSAFLLLINSYGSTIGSFKNFSSIVDILLFITFVIAGYILVFLGIISSSKVISLQYNYKIIENQVELQRKNYQVLNEATDKLLAIKHDMRHHFSVIKSLVEEKKYNYALEYIEKFNKNALAKSLPTLCQNFSADSITKYFMSVAISKNIDFKTDLDIPEEININSLDLCVVLGNCLENAIEACEKLDNNVNRYITLTSHIVDAHIVIKITNSFNGLIIKNADTFQSTKKEPSHGIGIVSVKETVKKYKGNFDIKHSDEQFEVVAILNINLSSVTL